MAVLTIAIIFLGTDKLSSQTSYTGMRGLSSLEITAEMAPGVNLWNTLDAVCWWCDGCSNGMQSETIWGNPYTTPEIVQAIADRGFNSLRIPVTWFNHMGAYPDYLIDEVWMDRVEELANYAFDANLYVIINIHHDDYSEDHEGSWLCPTYEKQDTVTDQLVKVWTQIATRFRDYGDYLIFETMNEPREVGGEKEWSGGTAEHRAVINAFNEAAVNAIRATGGNNESRFIMLPQVGANTASAIEDMIIPNGDTNTIVSFHAYSPYWFCQAEDGTSEWGTAEEVNALENLLASVGEKFIPDGIGVIAGEWGATDKDNYKQRINYYTTYANICKQVGITPIPWMYSFNRHTLSWEQPLIEDAVLQAYDPDKVEVKDIDLSIPGDTMKIGDSFQLSASIIPDSATFQNMHWFSNNPDVITVDAAGLLVAKSEGSAVISVSTIGKTVSHTLFVIDTVIQMNFRFEAEYYENNSGGRIQNCSDEGGGLSFDYLKNGNWSTYPIEIDTTGTYDFMARAATRTTGGTIEISIQDSVLNTSNVEDARSNDWDDWYTLDPVEIALEKGTHELKLSFTGSGTILFSLNWFEINYNRPLDMTSIPETADATFDFMVYPNPVSDKLTVLLPDHTANTRICIYNIQGQKIKEYMFSQGAQGINIDVSLMEKGMYILSVSADQQYTTRFIK